MNIQSWTLYYDNFGPLPCQAPCTMYSVLYDHKKITDPFYGTNERELQYLAEKDCTFESVFSAPPALLAREHIELTFHGLDTICHIYLNGTLLGKVKNMHREYVYEVKPLLTPGENTLRLEFKSPRRYFARQQHKHYLYMNDGDTLPGAAHLRKAMYQSGWDWGPTLPDMGIFRSVELNGWGVDRLGHQPLQELRLELPPVAGVGAPLARHHQPLAHCGQRDGTDHRYILSAAHVQPKDGVAVFVILIYHGADGALQNLQIFRQVVLSPILSTSFSGVQTVTPRSASQSRSASLMPKSTMVSSSRSSPSSRSQRYRRAKESSVTPGLAGA